MPEITPVVAPAPVATPPAVPVEAPPADPAAPPVAPVVDPAAPVAEPEKPAEKKEEPAPPPKVDLTAKFAALAKRERAIVEQEKKTKEALAAKEAELATKGQKVAELEQLLAGAEKKDYAKILAKLGLSFEDLTKWYVGGGKEIEQTQTLVSKETKALEEKLALQAKKIDEIEAARVKLEADRKAAEENQQIERSRIHVAEKVKADPKYELLNISGQASKVYETMLEIVAKDPSRGETPEKANALLVQVADALEAQLLAEHQALAKAQKFVPKPPPSDLADPDAAVVPGGDKSKKPKTIERADRVRAALRTLEGVELQAPSTVISTRKKTRAEMIADVAAKMGT